MPAEHFAYVFNSPQYGFGHIGHDGILLEDGDGPIELFSFHPYLNQGELFDKGSIASIADPSVATTFEAFERACMTPHPDIDHRNDDRGILLQNGTVEWNERIRRVLKMGITESQCSSMLSFARGFAEHPHRFDFLTYSCQHFVNDVLASGGIDVRSKHTSLRHDPIPNSFFLRATDRTRGVLSFTRIDFERSSDASV